MYELTPHKFRKYFRESWNYAQKFLILQKDKYYDHL